MKQSIYKPFLIFISLLFSVGLFLWYSSPVIKLNWGEWHFYTIKIYLPILVIGLVILTIFVFQREIILAKTEQREKDCRKIIKMFKLEKKQLQKIIKEYGIAEEKFNAIWNEIKDKINLSKLNDVPELAITLIEKIINIKDEYGVKLETQITGDISYLKNICITDLKETINLILQPICDNIRNLDIIDRRDINLFIREIENKIMIKVMHDYDQGKINTEIVQWNIKKILHKYGGNFTILNEKDEEDSDTYVLSLIIDIPKNIKYRRII